MRIFLSWSGEGSKYLASIIKRNIEAMLPPVNIFMSESDIDSGEKWGVRLQQELEDSQYGIICVTEENILSPWLLFEAGALSKYSDAKVCCLLMSKIKKNNVSGPLKQFQNKYFIKEEFSSLVFDINKQLGDLSIDKERLSTSLNNFWPSIKNEYHEAIEKFFKSESDLDIAAKNIENKLKEVKRWGKTAKNIYLLSVIKDSIEDFAKCFDQLSTECECFSQPYILYPNRLLNLLTNLSPTVKALALVDIEEGFWRDKFGMEIWRNTNENSSRVFVFQNKKQMRETFPTLINHSRKYNVYALSYDNLLIENNDYNYDYSIIGVIY